MISLSSFYHFISSCPISIFPIFTGVIAQNHCINQPKDLDQIHAIHVAGTKGKGSTSAFISSILSQYLSSDSNTTDTTGKRKLRKIGLYTSPHLRFVRERIKINNEPLSEAKFAQYFFEVWDRLGAAASAAGQPADAPGTRPVYFRYLTLMAFHAYISEGVDTAVIECGIGGEYDSTNILVKPAVTAVTSLGIDHVGMLGGTLTEIAWHKAGIFKQAVSMATLLSVRLNKNAVLKKTRRYADG